MLGSQRGRIDRFPAGLGHEWVFSSDEKIASVERVQLPLPENRPFDCNHPIDLPVVAQNQIPDQDMFDRSGGAIGHRDPGSSCEATATDTFDTVLKVAAWQRVGAAALAGRHAGLAGSVITKTGAVAAFRIRNTTAVTELMPRVAHEAAGAVADSCGIRHGRCTALLALVALFPLWLACVVGRSLADPQEGQQAACGAPARVLRNWRRERLVASARVRSSKRSWFIHYLLLSAVNHRCDYT